MDLNQLCAYCIKFLILLIYSTCDLLDCKQAGVLLVFIAMMIFERIFFLLLPEYISNIENGFALFVLYSFMCVSSLACLFIFSEVFDFVEVKNVLGYVGLIFAYYFVNDNWLASYED